MKGFYDNFQWEVVTESTQKLIVPGGWLYRTWLANGNSLAMAFVPGDSVVIMPKTEKMDGEEI